MNIGVITYRQYDENVLLDASLNVSELFKIILDDKDFSSFEIFDRNKNLLVSTHYPNVENKGLHISPVKVERKEEMKGVDYNAFRTPSAIYKTKIDWDVRGAVFRTKKKAQQYADKVNGKIIQELAKFLNVNTK